MKTVKTYFVTIIFTLLLSTYATSQTSEKNLNIDGDSMKTYVIERNIPEAGNFSSEDLVGISKKSCSVLDQMGSENIQWLHSYVTEDKIYCIYKARNKELLKIHAEKGGFPANYITEISTTISPKTAE